MNKLLIAIIVIIFCAILCVIHFKQKATIKRNIVFLSEKISLWMVKFNFYHAIYYELKKINNFFLMKFLWNSNRKCNNILKHLQDLQTIFDKLQQGQKITDIENMMLLTYDQLVTFLKQKYGLVSGSYFMDTTFTQTNPNIKKSSEGLEIHHIKEYQARGLSNPAHAKKYPFEYQKGINLVYCNLLEHFLLHLKICDYSKNPLHPEVGKKGSEIIFHRLAKIFFDNPFEYQKYQRKLAQKIYYQKNDFWKCFYLYQSLKVV